MSTMAKKIFVVDDEPNLLELIKVNLEAGGFEVAVASSGPKAIEFLKDYSPDAIILDGRLPGMDGWEICRIIKADERMKAVPVIFLSSATQKSDIQRAQDAGCGCFISKPFDPLNLIEVLETMLE